MKWDITLQRSWKTARVCGFVLRGFLETVESPVALERVKMNILEAIISCDDIKTTIYAVAGDRVVPHQTFVVYPSDKHRFLLGCHMKPLSDYAMDNIIMTLDDRDADAVFNLYQGLRGSLLAAAFLGNI